MLSCNPGKTDSEVIQFTSHFVRNLILHHFSFGDHDNIELSDKEQDIGVNYWTRI